MGMGQVKRRESVFFWLCGSVCAALVIGAGGAVQAEKTDNSGTFQQAAPGSMEGAMQQDDPEAAQQVMEESTSSAGAEKASSDDGAASEQVRNEEPGDLPEGQGVDVGSFGKIDLHVKDLKLTKVLELLSVQARKNVIASKNVTGSVSADLYDVDFYEALSAILHPNGYGYRQKGNFIYVYTADELKKIEKQDREKVHRIIELDYINADDAMAFVNPLLSSDGSVSVSAPVDEGFKPSETEAGANSFAHSGKLVVYDYAENVQEVVDVIDELDARPKQVLVEATILQARLTENNAFGVDFSLFSNLDVGDFSTPLTGVDEMISGTSATGESGSGLQTSPGQTGTGDSSIKIGAMGDDASVFVRALDSVTDTNVLATPKLLVLNRQKADLQVGQRLGYLSTTQTETASTETVEFLDVGTNLSLRPFVSSDGYVRMELSPSVSDGDTNREVQGNVIPEENTQRLTTNVLVESGQTVVLGGLFKEDTSVSRNQVPGLGDVPGLGALFQGQDDTVSRNEVIFLIKPTVVKDKQLADASEKLQRDIEDSRLGAREGLLPWSRTKLTSGHMKQALEHQRQGETDKALWDVNMALYLDPTMVDAIQLKEELTGEELDFYEYSRMSEAVDEMVQRQLDENQEAGKAEDNPANKPDANEADASEESDKQEADANDQSDMPDREMSATPIDASLESGAGAEPGGEESEQEVSGSRPSDVEGGGGVPGMPDPRIDRTSEAESE